jgi:hypothetical protein
MEWESKVICLQAVSALLNVQRTWTPTYIKISISRMLAKHIRSVGLPPRKISGFLRPVKNDLGLKASGVYSIPCECGQVYIGQTGRSIKTRIT